MKQGNLRTPFANFEWMMSKNKWAARSGWSLTAGKLAKVYDEINPDIILDRIEAKYLLLPMRYNGQ